MKIIYKRRGANWQQNLLCITHSDRPVELELCNLNYLELRYSDPERLPPSQPFESLTTSIKHSPHLGEVTVWEFRDDNFRKPRLLLHLRPNNYKPQFAIWHQQQLWILGVEVLEVYDSNLSRLAVIRDPWLSGAHTIIPDQKGQLLVSCSASDSVLVIDQLTHKLVRALRMPNSLYGFNYHLSRTDSVVDHYIINDFQLTHINCAWPWRDGILVSTLIQGAIGKFNHDEKYTELLRGFIGCHGARIDQRTGRIFFADSCLGTVVFLTAAYTIDYRIDARSKWLHDVHQMNGNIFALSVADRNLIEIMDCTSRKVITDIPCNDFGNSTQFIYFGK